MRLERIGFNRDDLFYFEFLFLVEECRTRDLAFWANPSLAPMLVKTGLFRTAPCSGLEGTRLG